MTNSQQSPSEAKTKEFEVSHLELTTSHPLLVKLRQDSLKSVQNINQDTRPYFKGVVGIMNFLFDTPTERQEEFSKYYRSISRNLTRLMFGRLPKDKVIPDALRLQVDEVIGSLIDLIAYRHFIYNSAKFDGTQNVWLPSYESGEVGTRRFQLQIVLGEQNFGGPLIYKVRLTADRQIEENDARLWKQDPMTPMMLLQGNITL